MGSLFIGNTDFKMFSNNVRYWGKTATSSMVFSPIQPCQNKMENRVENCPIWQHWMPTYQSATHSSSTGHNHNWHLRYCQHSFFLLCANSGANIYLPVWRLYSEVYSQMENLPTSGTRWVLSLDQSIQEMKGSNGFTAHSLNNISRKLGKNFGVELQLFLLTYLCFKSLHLH